MQQKPSQLNPDDKLVFNPPKKGIQIQKTFFDQLSSATESEDEQQQESIQEKKPLSKLEALAKLYENQNAKTNVDNVKKVDNIKTTPPKKPWKPYHEMTDSESEDEVAATKNTIVKKTLEKGIRVNEDDKWNTCIKKSPKKIQRECKPKKPQALVKAFFSKFNALNQDVKKRVILNLLITLEYHFNKTENSKLSFLQHVQVLGYDHLGILKRCITTAVSKFSTARYSGYSYVHRDRKLDISFSRGTASDVFAPYMDVDFLASRDYSSAFFVAVHEQISLLTGKDYFDRLFDEKKVYAPSQYSFPVTIAPYFETLVDIIPTQNGSYDINLGDIVIGGKSVHKASVIMGFKIPRCYVWQIIYKNIENVIVCKTGEAPRPKKLNIELQYQNIIHLHTEGIKQEVADFDRAHSAYLEEYEAYERECENDGGYDIKKHLEIIDKHLKNKTVFYIVQVWRMRSVTGVKAMNYRYRNKEAYLVKCGFSRDVAERLRDYPYDYKLYDNKLRVEFFYCQAQNLEDAFHGELSPKDNLPLSTHCILTGENYAKEKERYGYATQYRVYDTEIYDDCKGFRDCIKVFTHNLRTQVAIPEYTLC